MTALVDVSDLNIRFSGERTVHAVNDLSLLPRRGRSAGPAGRIRFRQERHLARADAAVAEESGRDSPAAFGSCGRDVLALDDEELSAFRGQTVSMIFQEPALALDPVYTIGQQIAETVMRHEGKSQSEARARALEMLEVVRIPSAKRGSTPIRMRCRAACASAR